MQQPNHLNNQAGEDKLTVFLTATLSSDDLMRELTGKPIQDRKDAILPGYDLVIQNIKQIPAGAQRLVRNSGWGDDFRSYNLTPGEGSIRGYKCIVTRDQWERLKDWDLVDFGWFTEKEVKIITDPETNQEERVLSIVMGEGQDYERKVDGYDFDPFLMPEEDTIKAAQRVRSEYDKRNGINPEGVALASSKELEV